MKQLPNILTISRIVLAVFFLLVVFQHTAASIVLATLIFLAAALTDYYDGYFAKRQSGITNFGKIMDPIADKVLILAAFYSLMEMGWVSAWMFWVILAREAGITIFRIIAMFQGKVLAAERQGKIKTVAQMTTIIAMFVTMIFMLTGFSKQWPAPLTFVWSGFLLISLWVSVILTVTSGVSYLWNNRKSLYA